MKLKLLLCVAMLALPPATVIAEPLGKSNATANSGSVGGAVFGKSGFGRTDEPEFLPVDQAFVFESLVEADQVVVHWRMPPGYYLYQHRLGVPGVTVADMPEGLQKFDEIFGDVKVYYDSLSLNIPRSKIEGESIVISYQGCADAGLCYPPQKRLVKMTQ